MATPKAQQRRENPSSPFSPTIAARKDEKDQLINLNNRLAVYVEKVRSLENENSHMQIIVKNFEQNKSVEVNNMKAMFEGELAEARRLLDELSKEKAQLQIEATSFREKYEAEKNSKYYPELAPASTRGGACVPDVARRRLLGLKQEIIWAPATNCLRRIMFPDIERSRASLLEHDKEVLEKKVKDLTTRLSSKEALYLRVKNEKDELAAEIGSLKAKLSELQDDLDSTQKMYENETLLRVDFENKLQSLKEELMFKERIYNEELAEVRRHYTVSITEASDKVKYDYEHKLEAAIIDLREQQQSDLDALKDELETQYSDKINNLTRQLEYSRKSQYTGQEAAKSAELKVSRLQVTIKELQNQNNVLQNRIQDFEGQIETERQLRFNAIVVIEKERDEARERLNQMEKDYNELLDIKLQLDQEIAVYRRLLEEEEQRLHLTPERGESSEGKGRTRSRRKRKRPVAQTTEGETRAKKKEFTSTSYTSETVVVERSQQSQVGHEDVLHQQAEPSPAGNNSCVVM